MRRKVVQGLPESRPDINYCSPNRADVHGRRDETGQSVEGMKVQPGKDWPRGFKLAMIRKRIHASHEFRVGGTPAYSGCRTIRVSVGRWYHGHCV